MVHGSAMQTPPTPSFLSTERGYRLAYHHQAGEGVGVVFCPGYRSDMTSTKATALAEFCTAQNIPLTRFDYHGHGASEREFIDFTIGGAMADLLSILDAVAGEEVILIGSSMGGWVALNAALERKGQVRGFIGIAAAPDFTERLMYQRFTPEQRRALEDEGVVYAYSEMSQSDYPITRRFIEEARQHVLLDDILGLEIPVHLLHGQADVDVPWETALLLAERLMSDEVTVTLIKDGDHRLNRPEDLARMTQALMMLLER
jgi:pimeloyl-ACP methyl ester carboxylesterase